MIILADSPSSFSSTGGVIIDCCGNLKRSRCKLSGDFLTERVDIYLQVFAWNRSSSHDGKNPPFSYLMPPPFKHNCQGTDDGHSIPNPTHTHSLSLPLWGEWTICREGEVCSWIIDLYNTVVPVLIAVTTPLLSTIFLKRQKPPNECFPYNVPNKKGVRR